METKKIENMKDDQKEVVCIESVFGADAQVAHAEHGEDGAEHCENCAEIGDESDADADAEVDNGKDPRQVHPFEGHHCEDCEFFIKSISDGNRYGWCCVKKRTTFTRYGCTGMHMKKL